MASFKFGRKRMVAASPIPQHPPLAPRQEVCPPEQNSEAVDDVEMPLPSNPQTFFLCGLFALGVLAVLYVGSSIILPVVLAFVLNLLLQPGVRLLARVRVPRAVGALLAIILVVAVLVGLVAGL